MRNVTIGIIGASGFVGRRVAQVATQAGYGVVLYSRTAREGFRKISADEAVDFSDVDVVVNLAGEPILGLWTEEKKKAIQSSRVQGTRRVVEGVLEAKVPVLINASAIGFYGNTREISVDESSPVGSGFLAETCLAWEAATEPAAEAGVRVVKIRIGFVLGPGGAMHAILPVFRFGLGGTLGDGKQWMSCVHLDDVAGLILWAAGNPDIEGAVNAVMPEPIRNTEFTKSLAAALHRPAFFPVPAFLLRLALGQLSHVMLDSSRVRPTVAQREGYVFRFPTLTSALEGFATPK